VTPTSWNGLRARTSAASNASFASGPEEGVSAPNARSARTGQQRPPYCFRLGSHNPRPLDPRGRRADIIVISDSSSSCSFLSFENSASEACSMLIVGIGGPLFGFKRRGGRKGYDHSLRPHGGRSDRRFTGSTRATPKCRREPCAGRSAKRRPLASCLAPCPRRCGSGGAHGNGRPALRAPSASSRASLRSNISVAATQSISIRGAMSCGEKSAPDVRRARRRQEPRRVTMLSAGAGRTYELQLALGAPAR